MPLTSVEPLSFTVHAQPEFRPAVESMLRSLLPDVRFGSGRLVTVEVTMDEGGIDVAVVLDGVDEGYRHRDEEIALGPYPPSEWERRAKERVRLGVYSLVGRALSLPRSPWGTLVGVRPTKLVHRFLDKGAASETVRRQLADLYDISEDRLSLLLDVAHSQRVFFRSKPGNPVSIYVGVPFCPTRCRYCSFAAYPLTTHGHLVDGFVRTLLAEIEMVGDVLGELGISVESVYVGGGTPTSLEPEKLEMVLEAVNQRLAAKGCQEFTVEAGRPETLTPAVVSVLQRARVDRISINPQSMHQSSLDTIGRAHSVADVVDAFARCRQAGIPSINSDVILGLPGETLQDVNGTLEQLSALHPDALTVHALARKRASSWRSELAELRFEQGEAQRMGDAASQAAASLGMAPYYLYRQRFLFGDLENVGYARPGHESMYNIQMMEERQTVIGLGAGAVTKWVTPSLTVSRTVNPKCPAAYTEQMTAEIDQRKAVLRQSLHV